MSVPPAFPPPPASPDPGAASGPETRPSGGGAGRGAWSPEEIAELNRRALTAQGPPGKKGAAEEAAAEKKPRRSSQGTVGRWERKRYLVHSREEEENKPLEPPVPWTAFFAFVFGVCTVLMSDTLAPLGLALAVGAVALAGWTVFVAARFRRLQGVALAVAGAGIGIGFASIHYTAFVHVRHSLPALYAVVNRGTGNSALYRLQEVDTDFKKIDDALKRHYQDLVALPPCASGQLGANADVPSSSEAHGILTFRAHVMSYDTFSGLTTPVAYFGRYPIDPFAPAYGATYGYYATKDFRFALLWSPGPDQRYDIDPERDFVPGDPASRDRLTELRWDPTNGIRSQGDVFFVSAMPEKPQIDPATGLPIVPSVVPIPPRVPSLAP